jgi:hypothetical protein
MNTLLSVGITTAQTTTSTKADALDLPFHRSLLLQANFVYGSGGTSVDAWIQSSADGGVTWFDVANFHFTTSSLVKLYNLSNRTAVTSIATPTDGALSANTSVDGLLGDRLRVKWSSVGTYAGGTNLTITAIER